VETLESRPSPPGAGTQALAPVPSLPSPPHEWTWRDRLRGARLPAALLAGGVAACTYVAMVDPNGAGGYPACPLQVMTGIDCPGCGMTRAAFALMHGDLGRALDHNLVFVIALPFLLWAVARWAAASMGWTLVLWLVICLETWAVALALGIDMPFAGSWLMLALLVVGVAVPTPGGIGGFHEAFRLGATSFFAADNDAAVGAAILLHASSFVPVTVLGLWYATQEGLNMKGITDMTQGTDPAEANA